MDVFHCNAIEILDRDVPGLGGRGDALLSFWSFDAVFVVDLRTGRATWRWGRGVLENAHHPTVLPNGNLLIFDNGTRRKWSRVIEVDPATRRIVWQYRATPPRGFFSKQRGAAQLLPNGNVLVTESDRGRVFEVTRAGDVVWEFFNPDVRVRDGTRAAIYRMQRVADGSIRLEAGVFSRLIDRVRSALPRAG